MASIVYTVLLIASLLFLVRKKEEAESYFSLKIMGYFILGSFAFKFNQTPLPVGFIVYLLFFRPGLHVNVKRMASVFGVLTFILVHWILPFAIHEWQSRPISIEHELGSIYTMNFQDEYNLVRKELKLKNHSLRLEDFEAAYGKNGRITDLNWQLIGHNGNSYHVYQIRYEFDKSRYVVTHSQLDSWLQYNRLIESEQFFENLSVLDIQDITHAKGNFSSYGIRSTGEIVHYAIENGTHFLVINGEVHLLKDEQLPIEGYYISTFAMKKTDEKRDEKGRITQESFEGTESADYVFEQ